MKVVATAAPGGGALMPRMTTGACFKWALATAAVVEQHPSASNMSAMYPATQAQLDALATCRWELCADHNPDEVDRVLSHVYASVQPNERKRLCPFPLGPNAL
jgi:hypothetical protein